MTDWNRFYWTSGSEGRLRFHCCVACGALQHPPAPVCRNCRSDRLELAEVCGRGVVQSHTTNHQQWSADFPAPYTVAVVAIDEDPRVRVTTNIVGCAPERVHVGMRVRAVFDQIEDVWLPRFTPVDEPPTTLGDERAELARIRSVRPMPRLDKFEDRVAVTGIGMSRLGRKLMVDPVSLTVEAITTAVADAGLAMSDIDGLSTYPAGTADGGYSEGGVTAVETALGIRPSWHNGGPETPGATGSLIAAFLAVASGLCRHVVCFRTVWQSTYAELMRNSAPNGVPRRVSGIEEYLAPYGVQAANTVAMAASQHFARYGTTRETLGWIALNARANAALNPTAIYRTPLTMEQYLDARPISTPLGLFDCDPLCDGSVAVVVSAADAAADLPNPPVRVEAVGMQITERMEWDQGVLSHEPHVLGPAAHMWSRTTLRPADVDVAELYDGFTFNCLSWIEALGFCGIGEAKDFLDGGRSIALDGEIPVNTHGGQLSHGRTHGMGLVHEAITQLRGAAGPRQVGGAATAVVSSGGLTPGGVILFRVDQ
nr:OB-fold domain-containing protein [Mycolicibacterium sp. BK634]